MEEGKGRERYILRIGEDTSKAKVDGTSWKEKQKGKKKKLNP